eukprot:COSAG01_NODE_63712_length_279_cov_0.566667_1_plen_40_part_01
MEQWTYISPRGAGANKNVIHPCGRIIIYIHTYIMYPNVCI